MDFLLSWKEKDRERIGISFKVKFLDKKNLNLFCKKIFSISVLDYKKLAVFSTKLKIKIQKLRKKDFKKSTSFPN